MLRLIPARAGNTKRRPLAGNRKPAHPRSRGEHLPPSSSTTESSGSSPLARGTQAFSTFTNTRTLAHPRSRGEHSHAIIRGNLQFGSSPLARGTLLVRGQWLVPPPGSSPLARGTLLHGRHESRRVRLIPARAGNTARSRRATRSGQAHPRSRGEHARKEHTNDAPPGSSPLARGTQIHGELVPFLFRLIPARAGNTTPGMLKLSPTTAHPRSRGEHSGPLWSRAHPRGSSPLARGTRSPTRGKLAAFRLIPARAGNTW